MYPCTLPTHISPEAIAALRRKVSWRILPLVILLYFAAYLDRANVGFAKLRMARDLQAPAQFRRT